MLILVFERPFTEIRNTFKNDKKIVFAHFFTLAYFLLHTSLAH